MARFDRPISASPAKQPLIDCNQQGILPYAMVPLTVLGGGPAGLSVAFYATRAGLPFELFERSRFLGGLCRTFQCGSHRYDSGAHRFHDRDAGVTNDLRRLLGDRLATVTAPSKVHLGGRFLDFPPTPLNAVFGAGLKRAARIGADLVRVRLRKRSIRNFADFAVQNFGKALAQDFLLNYSEKVWGLPADQLSARIATRRLTGMNLATLAMEFLKRSETTRHLDGGFLYPRQGYGEITQKLAAQLPPEAIRTRHEVSRLDVSEGHICRILFSDSASISRPGRVVSTLPLTVLVDILGQALPHEAHRARRRLRFRHVRLLFLRLGQPQASSNASIYLPDTGCCISRVYEPKNRSAAMAPPDETALVAEVPCFQGDPVWRLSPEQLCRRVSNELEDAGLLQPARILQWRHHLLANAYPVYSVGFDDHVSTIQRSLERIKNLDTLGRNALFWYSHLHDQMRLGKQCVERQRALQQCGSAKQQSIAAL